MINIDSNRRICTQCNREKPHEEFRVRSDRPRVGIRGGCGLTSKCAACLSTNQRLPKSEWKRTMRKLSKVKTCSTCKIEKSINEFYERKNRQKVGPGLHSKCKSCARTARNNYQRKYNPEWIKNKLKKDPQYARRKNLWKNYKITIEQFNNMLLSQGGCCAVCKGPPMGKGQFHVDHDHATNKIRGLLCHKCNVALGMVNDSVDHLSSLMGYVRANTPDTVEYT